MTTDRPTCAQCDCEITGTPVRDPEQEAWLGFRADTYCGPECLDRAAEIYFEYASDRTI